MRRTMTAWIAVLIPVLIMVFALGMERLETRLRAGTVREDEVEDFLERARPDEVKALFRQGIGGALQMFRLRNLGKRGAGSRRGRPSGAAPRSTTKV
jgi:hypothetical protein